MLTWMNGNKTPGTLLLFRANEGLFVCHEKDERLWLAAGGPACIIDIFSTSHG